MANITYTAFVHCNSDGYGVTFPDLPGCITVGATLDETARNAREVLSLHIEGMVRDGDDLPEPAPAEHMPSDPEYPEIGRMDVQVDLPTMT